MNEVIVLIKIEIINWSSAWCCLVWRKPWQS